MLQGIRRKFAKLINHGMYAPGHFYNPIPDVKELKALEKETFGDFALLDIDLNTKAQIDFLKECQPHYERFPYKNEAPVNRQLRYASDNGYFNITDALGLFSILNSFQPERIVEVGSGYSSALMLDTIEGEFQRQPEVTFIEPYPDRLLSLLNKSDLEYCHLIQEKVQHVDMGVFRRLKANDLLFIDSSHITKAGSDVNHILFKILPSLNKGVVIHFHDVCHPFEYPKEWIYDGIYWNEAYLLRAFLMNNNDYEIVLFNHFMSTHCREWLDAHIPLFKSGGSLYIRKK